MRRATDDDVRQFEKHVDDHFEAALEPNSSYVETLFAVISVCEDQMRLLIAQHESVPLCSAVLLGHSFVQRIYQVLRLVARRLRPVENAQVPAEISGEWYQRAHRLLKASADYETAVELFGEYWAGYSSCDISSDGKVLVFASETSVIPYEVSYHYQGAALPTVWDLFVLLLRDEVGPPDVVVEIMERVTAGTNGTCVVPVYEFDHQLGKRLAEVLPRPQQWVPENWRFPWGTCTDTLSLCHAMVVRCFYHQISIHFGARRLGMEGVGGDALALVTDATTLNKVLSELSAVPLDVAEPVLEAIRYGTRVESPDQALQPLIPLDSTRLIVASGQVLALNMQRNLLALHARQEPSTFDSQSGRFETNMIDRVREVLVATDYRWWCNERISIGESSEEVDVIVADDSSGVVVFVECRWILPTGTIRDTTRRRNDVEGKIQQVRRKIEACREEPTGLQTLLNPPAGKKRDWDIRGAVVLENHGGTPCPAGEATPTLPLHVFLRSLVAAPDLGAAWLSWVNLEWLPVEGQHFRMQDNAISFGDHRVAFALPVMSDGTDWSTSLPDESSGGRHSVPAVRTQALKLNADEQGLECIATHVPYAVILAALGETGVSETTGRRLGAALVRRLIDAADRLLLITLALGSPALTADERSLANRISTELERDATRNVMRKPRAYYLPDDDGIAVGLVVTAKFWEPERW